MMSEADQTRPVQTETSRNEQQPAGPQKTDRSDSSTSTVCRICQLTEKESGQPMSQTGCKCHGSLSACHQTCLQRWVDSRLNDRCEICEEEFGIHVSPETLYAESEPMLTNIEPPQTITCAESRRTFFFIIFFLLFFATVASITLTAYTNQDYIRQQLRFWNASVDVIVLEDMKFVYGLSISILVFSACMCISVGLIWAFAELYMWPQERYIRRQQIMQLARMLNEGTPSVGPGGDIDSPVVEATNNDTLPLPLETLSQPDIFDTYGPAMDSNLPVGITSNDGMRTSTNGVTSGTSINPGVGTSVTHASNSSVTVDTGIRTRQ